MTLPPLGIDISNLKFDVALLREAGKLKHRVFPNSAAGFSRLSAWLGKQVGRARACLEATGAYSEALATTCTSGGTSSRSSTPRRSSLTPRATSPAPRPTRPTPPSSPGSARSGARPGGAPYRRRCASYRRSSAHTSTLTQGSASSETCSSPSRHRRDDCGQDTGRDHGRETLRKRQALSGIRRTPPGCTSRAAE